MMGLPKVWKKTTKLKYSWLADIVGNDIGLIKK